MNLRQLYQDPILDHYKNPRNRHGLDHANRQGEGYNPLCGDKLTIYVQIENGLLNDLSFTGTGCAIFIASASMMTQALKGKTESEAKGIIEHFNQMVTGSSDQVLNSAILGELSVFSGVRGYPVRVKCATLAWNALRAAIEETNETVTTE